MLQCSSAPRSAWGPEVFRVVDRSGARLRLQGKELQQQLKAKHKQTGGQNSC